MILISGTIRLIQELRAKNATRQLDRLIHDSITVKCGGELQEIPAEKLVVGDVVLRSAGDRVPADIRLTKVTDLFTPLGAALGFVALPAAYFAYLIPCILLYMVLAASEVKRT